MSNVITQKDESAKNASKMIQEEEEVTGTTTTCGLGSWRPACLQFLATPQFFALNFSIVGILQGALFTYMVSIMSTLERRYGFESKVSGAILIADNLSGMIASPAFGYLGSKYNRSLLIGLGELIVALAALTNALPYYLYGPGVHLLSSEMDSSLERYSNTSNGFELCIERKPENCSIEEEDGGVGGGGSSSVLLVPVIILWLSSFTNGLGYTAFYTIGVPYIDDNVSKKNSAMYLSYVATLRFLGPTLGFLLSSFALSFYENPFIDPGIKRNDPRWIGAWWLGFLILGGLLIIFSVPMLMFPVTFKSKKKKKSIDEKAAKVERKEAEAQFDGALNALKRLSTNYLFLFHISGSTLRLIGFLGYYIVKPKYIELQYRQSASSAAFFTGATSVITMAIGTMAGGVFIRFTKPGPRRLATFVVLLELVSSMGIFSSMFLNCPTPSYGGLPGSDQSCHSSCHCSTSVYQPICSADGVTNYFSPCFAGCKSGEERRRKSDSKQFKFSQCSCMSEHRNVAADWATSGRCPVECNKFPIYISVLSFCNLIASTARTGDTLLTLRSVEPRDKSFAFGIIGTVFSIFAFIPYPLIFGAITDASCLVWKKSTGGNCWLYDIDKLRLYLHIGSLAFLLLGISLEIGMIVFANRISNLYDEEEEPKEVAENKKN